MPSILHVRFTVLLTAILAAVGCGGKEPTASTDGTPALTEQREATAAVAPPAAQEPAPVEQATEGTTRETPAVVAPSEVPAKVDATETPAAAPPEKVTDAEAVMAPTSGSTATGTVRFHQTKKGVRVTVSFTGLTPKTEHGFHIHEKGDCSAPDGSSAGGHYNPANVPHALPTKAERHAGDMGNLKSNAKGVVTWKGDFENFSLQGTESVVGRGVILHEKADQGTQPSGDAGGRIACGVVMATKEVPAKVVKNFPVTPNP